MYLPKGTPTATERARAYLSDKERRKIEKENSKKIEELKHEMEVEHENSFRDSEMEDVFEKAAQEKVMARFLLQIEKPYWSDNIYMELDMTNLRMFYERAQKEYEDICKYFLITD